MSAATSKSLKLKLNLNVEKQKRQILLRAGSTEIVEQGKLNKTLVHGVI